MITPSLSIRQMTSLNGLLTIITGCQEVCKNGSVRVRKGQTRLFSQAMMRLADISGNYIEDRPIVVPIVKEETCVNTSGPAKNHGTQDVSPSTDGPEVEAALLTE
jgi:hypothetical protein